MVDDSGQEDNGQGEAEGGGLHAVLNKVKTLDITSEQGYFPSLYSKHQSI